MTDVDSACNSFWEVEGTGAGATGAAGTVGAAQHAILQQCRQWPQHDFAAGEVPDVAMTGYAARINPSSNATAILVSFKAMPVLYSFLIREPSRLSHIGAGKQMFIRRWEFSRRQLEQAVIKSELPVVSAKNSNTREDQ